jgi:hypothetical protein
MAEVRALRDGMANIVNRYTVALVLEKGLASGVLVSHGSRMFVATAKHVVDVLNLNNPQSSPKRLLPSESLSTATSAVRY